jgi:RecB family endonuclease NucS
MRRISLMRYSVIALGYNTKGDFVGSATNTHRFLRPGGSIHAEMNLLRKFKCIRRVEVYRVKKDGTLVPMIICANCRKVLDKKGIRYETIHLWKMPCRLFKS